MSPRRITPKVDPAPPAPPLPPPSYETLVGASEYAVRQCRLSLVKALKTAIQEHQDRITRLETTGHDDMPMFSNAGRVDYFARELAVSEAHLKSLTDPALVKLLNLAKETT